VSRVLSTPAGSSQPLRAIPRPISTFAIPAAVLFEAFLSFLGLGLPPPTPSWGAMAADGYHGMDFAPHIVLAPTIALSITLMAFNWLGDGLRDAFDPRMRR